MSLPLNISTTLDPSVLSDVDASGFRNPSDQGQHEIVAIGDSQTQGYHVEWQDAWPYQLGRMLDKSVYSFAIGGYGIYQYHYLAREAVKHKPEYVILGLYPPNDIQPHACNSVNFAYYEKEFLKSGIASSSEKCSGRPKDKTKSSFKVTRYSGILSALEYLRKKYIRPKTAHIFSRKKYVNFGGIYVLKRQAIKHNRFTDMSLKKVRGNYDISKIIFSSMDKKLRDNGIKFGVIIIPSKGRVVERWATYKGVAIPDNFPLDNEKELFAKYLAFFKEQGIPAIDTTPYVVKAYTESVELGEEFYPFENDHPFEKGYGSYALAATKLISQIDQNTATIVN